MTQVEEKALALKYVPFTVRDGGGFEYLPDLFRGQNSIDSNLWVRLCGFFSQGALFCQRISPILEQVLAFFIPATKVSFDQEEEI